MDVQRFFFDEAMISPELAMASDSMFFAVNDLCFAPLSGVFMAKLTRNMGLFFSFL